MTFENVLYALKRQGIGGMGNITKQGDYLVWYKDGTINVDSGTNTHVAIMFCIQSRTIDNQ